MNPEFLEQREIRSRPARALRDARNARDIMPQKRVTITSRPRSEFG